MTAITQPQKATIQRLLRKAEFDTVRIGLIHARRIPHIEQRNIDMPVDVWIGSLSKQEAGDVIDFLVEATEGN